VEVGGVRRGLSPLVATIVLIAFTVLGGVIVYEFFMKTAESAMASGETLIVSATKSYFDNTRVLVQVDMVNGYRTNITITGFNYITPAATTTNAQIVSGSPNVNLVPGAKYTVILLVPSDAKAIVISYKARNQNLVETVAIG
jgi:flagellin-like protein